MAGSYEPVPKPINWTMDRVALFAHEACSAHDTGWEHPEHQGRLRAVMSALGKALPELNDRVAPLHANPALLSEILRVHTDDHVATVRGACQRAAETEQILRLDPDTAVSGRSWDAALGACGAALDAMRWVGKGEGPAAFCPIRPPGHHATADRPMGFCLFNNVAITAAKLLADGYERIAIIDWDVHHGNGTQALFHEDPRVLFFSMHQWPHYPGTGDVLDCGKGAGAGYTVNIPMPAWCADNDYAHAFEMLIEPVVNQFAPQAILVSAGQDIHRDDPLGDMNVSEVGFAQMAWRCARMSRNCNGRLAFILEGGYDRHATAQAIETILRAVVDGYAPAVGECSPRGGSAISKARVTQAAYWYLW